MGNVLRHETVRLKKAIVNLPSDEVRKEIKKVIENFNKKTFRAAKNKRRFSERATLVIFNGRQLIKLLLWQELQYSWRDSTTIHNVKPCNSRLKIGRSESTNI